MTATITLKAYTLIYFYGDPPNPKDWDLGDNPSNVGAKRIYEDGTIGWKDEVKE